MSLTHVYVDTYRSEDPAAELLELLTRRPAWMKDASCREHPDVSFFPEQGQDVRPALGVCASCLVREECAAYAMADYDCRLHGIWGGTTARGRRRGSVG